MMHNRKKISNLRITVSRAISYDAFIDVMERGKSPEKSVQELLKSVDSPLNRLDRNLVKEILFGTLRWYAKLFWILQKTSKRDLKAVSP